MVQGSSLLINQIVKI